MYVVMYPTFSNISLFQAFGQAVGEQRIKGRAKNKGRGVHFFHSPFFLLFPGNLLNTWNRLFTRPLYKSVIVIVLLLFFFWGKIV